VTGKVVWLLNCGLLINVKIMLVIPCFLGKSNIGTFNLHLLNVNEFCGSPHKLTSVVSVERSVTSQSVRDKHQAEISTG